MTLPRCSIAISGALMLAATAASAAPQGEAPLAVKVNDPTLEWGPCPSIFPPGCQIAVLHGDPAKPNADVFLRVPAGQRLPTHTHTSAERMILVTGELRVKYQGVAAVTLTPGMYAFGPAGLPHEADCRAGAACALFIAFEGPVDAAAFPTAVSAAPGSGAALTLGADGLSQTPRVSRGPSRPGG